MLRTIASLSETDPPLDAFQGVKVVLLNGPAGSGKDSAGNHLADNLGFWNMKFAGALKRSVYADHGLPTDLPLDFFESIKEEPLGVFFGKSFRQACIHKSENMMKPAFGPRVFGRLFLRELWQNYRNGASRIVVTDSGFAPEALAMVPYIGAENMLLVQIRAESRGKTFANDSRNYIELPDVTTVVVTNNGPLPGYLKVVYDLVDHWLEFGTTGI